MSILVDELFNSFNSLYDNIKDFIEFQKKLDVPNDLIGEMTDEDIDRFGDEYKLYYSKLDYVKKMSEDDNRNKHIDMVLTIDGSMEISDKEKMKSILSYAVLVDFFDQYESYSQDELLGLSIALNNSEIDDYSYYLEVLSDERVIDRIISKNDGLLKKVTTIKELMKIQEKNPYSKTNELIDNAVIFLENNYDMSK